MNDKAREARREYMRQWRRKHPEKTKQYIAAYWDRIAQKQTSGKETREYGSV